MITTTRNSPWLALPAKPARCTLLASESARGPLDLLLEEISPGHAEFSTESSLPGPGDAGSDGSWSTLLDLTLGAAVQSMLPIGGGYRVIGLQTSAMPSARNSGDLTRAIADVVRAGGRVVTARGRLLDAGGALLATASLVALADHDVALAPTA